MGLTSLTRALYDKKKGKEKNKEKWLLHYPVAGGAEPFRFERVIS
jgi:hypothetical protein